MAKPHPGNGSGKFGVGVHDMGGWVRVKADGSPTGADELAVYLSHRLSEWLRENAHVRLLCVVPVSKEISDEQAAAFFVNPATALVMTRWVLRVPRGAWLLQTAAGSALDPAAGS